MKNQMRKDFEALPEVNQSAMRFARKIVEDHIAAWGYIPHPDKLKDEIAFYLDLVALQSVHATQGQKT